MDGVANMVTTAGDRFSTNLRKSFSTMTLEKWIRVVMVVGAYLLLRPYLIKLGARSQMKVHERDEAEAAAAAISPNQLRGQVEIPDDSSDDEEPGKGAAAASGADWGKKARRRQRDVIRKLLDAEEQRLRELQEDEEDKDIEEFLIKD